MARSITVGGAGGIDASDFRAVARALRRASPALARDLRHNLRKAGDVVAQEARQIAGQHSTSIPPTIRVRTSGASVSVVAGGGSKGTEPAAIAGLFELGNTRGRGRAQVADPSGKFRHPVYGHRNRWADQSMHPFLAPAGERKRPAVEALVEKALDEAVRTIVFED